MEIISTKPFLLRMPGPPLFWRRVGSEIHPRVPFYGTQQQCHLFYAGSWQSEPARDQKTCTYSIRPFSMFTHHTYIPGIHIYVVIILSTHFTYEHVKYKMPSGIHIYVYFEVYEWEWYVAVARVHIPRVPRCKISCAGNKKEGVWEGTMLYTGLIIRIILRPVWPVKSHINPFFLEDLFTDGHYVPTSTSVYLPTQPGCGRVLTGSFPCTVYTPVPRHHRMFMLRTLTAVFQVYI